MLGSSILGEVAVAVSPPYPSFEPGPYRDFSQPGFGDHRELRSGSFATHERFHHRRYRNFFTPGRSDVFVGFRTAASQSSICKRSSSS